LHDYRANDREESVVAGIAIVQSPSRFRQCPTVKQHLKVHHITLSAAFPVALPFLVRVDDKCSAVLFVMQRASTNPSIATPSKIDALFFAVGN
jgi:hypothetical protein